jgi:hypothetical protein
MNPARYGSALKFARSLHGDGDTTNTAALLAHAAAHGENTPLLSLADLFEEHGHPVAELLRRAGGGEGETDPDANTYSLWERDAVRTPTPDWDHPRIPNDHPLLPRMVPTGENFPGTDTPRHTLGKGHGAVDVKYLNHPSGHHFLLTIDSADRRPDSKARLVKRQFVLPATEDQVREYAEGIRDGEPRNADHILATLGARHPEPVPFAREFAAAVKFGKAKTAAPVTDADLLLRSLTTDHAHELLDTSGNAHTRHVVADKLDEDGRHREASLLRSKDPVGVHHGRVWSGNWESLPVWSQEYVNAALDSQPHLAGTMADYFRGHEVSPTTLAKMHADFSTFAEKNGKHPGEINPVHFHLARNLNGGFEDHPGVYGERRAARLQKRAEKMGMQSFWHNTTRDTVS